MTKTSASRYQTLTPIKTLLMVIEMRKGKKIKNASSRIREKKPGDDN